ncbi:MAG: FAD-dependent oxidoreductase [Adlercreutzia equolifaciens]
MRAPLRGALPPHHGGCPGEHPRHQEVHCGHRCCRHCGNLRAACPTGKRVAVVGAGPSGLTCAYFLGLMGHSVTVFERRSRLGGMMRYGIPAYRLPRERLDEDIRAVLGAGDIEVRTGCDIQTDKMRSLVDEFDAVYVAVGAQGGKTLPIEGADAAGVMSAVDVLEAIGDEQYPDFTGKNVVVIGGGNVAMDCARTAVRAGAASVTVAYRRRLEDMTALPSEVEAAMMEGVEMRCLQAPARIEANGEGQVTALICQPQRIGRCCAAGVRPRYRPTSPRCAWLPTLSSSPWGRPSNAPPSKSSACSTTAPICAPMRACKRPVSTPSSWAATASGGPKPSSWPSPRARRRRPTSTSCWASIISWTAALRCRRRIPTTAPPTGACRWPSARRASANAISSTWKSR